MCRLSKENEDLTYKDAVAMLVVQTREANEEIALLSGTIIAASHDITSKPALLKGSCKNGVPVL